MSYIEKYKNILAIVVSTICLFIALFLPARYALSAEMHKEFESIWDVWTGINWIFLSLSVIFGWGEIAKLATTFQDFIKRKAN